MGREQRRWVAGTHTHTHVCGAGTGEMGSRYTHTHMYVGREQGRWVAGTVRPQVGWCCELWMGGGGGDPSTTKTTTTTTTTSTSTFSIHMWMWMSIHRLVGFCGKRLQETLKGRQLLCLCVYVSMYPCVLVSVCSFILAFSLSQLHSDDPRLPEAWFCL